MGRGEPGRTAGGRPSRPRRGGTHRHQGLRPSHHAVLAVLTLVLSFLGYTRDQWLALLPTTGGLTRLAPGPTAGILEAVGAAIDRLGGRFTMAYTTLVTSAVRHSAG